MNPAPSQPTPSSPEPGSRLPLPSLGPRGEGWLVMQVLLIIAILAVGVWGPPWPAAASPWRWIAGAVLALLGAAMGLAGILNLGRQLTPLPRPVDDGVLRAGGAYGLVRHPMYGGVLLMVVGWTLFTSPLGLTTAAVAALFVEAKRRMEEAWLEQRHPEYADYRRRVRWRLIPFLW